MAVEQVEPNIQRVSLKDLFLDPNNFRITHETDYVPVDNTEIKKAEVTSRTQRLMVGPDQERIQDLIDSFKTKGYVSGDQVQAGALDDGGYVVAEGNRRVAALKHLEQGYLENNAIGQLDPAIFEGVPVVLLDEVNYLVLRAQKQIGGNPEWSGWNLAKLLDKLRHLDLAEDDLCQRVGISRREYRLSMRALALANHYRQSDYGDQFNESMFPLFLEILCSIKFKIWLDWDEGYFVAKNVKNVELLFRWLSRVEVDSGFDENKLILSKSGQMQDPIISTRNNVVALSRILANSEALATLDKTRDIVETTLLVDPAMEVDRMRWSPQVSRAYVNEIIEETMLDLQKKFNETVSSAIKESVTFVQKDSKSPTVFSDKIDRHFSDLHIQSFHCLHNLTIGKLSRINLFGGPNNSGKTSLLEAIYLLCKQNDANGLIDVLRFRGKIPEAHIPSVWLAQQLTESLEVSGIFNHQKATIGIREVEEDSVMDRSQYLKTVEINSEYDSVQNNSLLRLFEGRPWEKPSGLVKLLARVVYSSPFFLNEPHHYSIHYQNAIQAKVLPRIISFLKKFLLPSINDIHLVAQNQRFLVVDDAFEQAMDLTSYGEGFQRVFLTSLLFASAENGVLLIDEFENAIHSDLIKQYVPYIYALAKEFNVQVFLTSHSKECIDAFVYTIDADSRDDFTFHAMVRKDNQIEIRDLDGKHFARLLKATDADLRKAK